jgi:hypothetical protein
MTSIPGFWDIGPHEPLPVENTWREFVRKVGGEVVEDLVPEPRNFENADFLFAKEKVVAELKVVETEFSSSDAFFTKFDQLMSRVVEEDPSWRPELFGGSGAYPKWFYPEFVRIFRPPVSRILKKANRQIRDTKSHFKITDRSGVLIFVNDGFTSLGPEPIRALACSLLQHSYSSIDCFLYLTVNRYIEFPDSDTPRLLWAPVYSERASDSLVDFIDSLGRRWFNNLESIIGPFTHREETPVSEASLSGSRAIIIPNTNGG